MQSQVKIQPMKEVILKIKGTQTIGDNEPDVIEMITEGEMDINERRIRLVYSEDESMDGIQTELMVDGNKTAMIKRGSASANRLVIQKGKRHLCHYIIPQGEMMIGVFGEKIENTLGETGGELFLSYTIDINMGLLSRNQVEISVEVVE